MKYGALSNLAGTVNLVWGIEKKKDGAILRLEWKEAGGPAVSPPTRKGFGSRLIERALRGENGAAEMRFEPAGLRCSLTIPLTDSPGA